MRRHHSPKCPLALSCLALAVSSVAFAEQEEFVLEEIIVTAQKRAQALEEVPISISAFSGEALSDAGLNSANDIANLVPGLRIDLNGAAAQPSIRGVGSSLAGTGFTSNIAVYIDGFYVPSQYHTDMQLLNLKSVQVLKGPQGTLFGRNATGGAILLETKDASVETEMEAELTLASDERRVANIYASTGLTDSVAVDFAGLYEESDSFIENVATGENDFGAYDKHTYRASIIYDNEEDLKLEFAYAHSEADDPRAHAFAPYEGHTLGPIYAPAFSMTAVTPDDYGEVSTTAPTSYTSESDGYYLTVEKELGDMLLKSFTMKRYSESKSELDLDATNIPVFSVEFSPESESFSQEFNLSGQSGKLDWIAGIFYMDYEEEFHNLASLEQPLNPGSPTPIFTIYDLNRTSIESKAVFVDATYEIVDDLFLTAGLRHSKEKAWSEVRGHAFVGDMPEWSEDWSSTTPRAVLRYQMEGDSSVYLSYSEGFKAGMLQPSATTTTPIDQEEIGAWEIGYKTNRGSIRFDASVFHYDYTDLQVASFNGTQALVVNAADSTIYGADFQLTAAIGERLELSVGAAYTHATYDDFPGSQPRNLDATSPTYLQLGAGNAKDNSMMRTPEWTGTIAMTYTIPLSNGDLRLNGNLAYSDDFYFDPNEQFEQEAYTLVNLRATWVAPGDKVSVAVYGTNVTDEEYISALLPGDQAIERGYGEPASYGVTVGYKY